MAGCVAVAHVFGLTLCPLKRLLGVPCPTCGTTRAVALLLQGDVCGAFEMQPLAMTVVALLVPMSMAVRLALGAHRAKRLWLSIVRLPVFWFAVVIVILSNWVYVIVWGN